MKTFFGEARYKTQLLKTDSDIGRKKIKKNYYRATKRIADAFNLQIKNRKETKNMKKITSLLLVLAMMLTCAFALASCGTTPQDPNAKAESLVTLDINPSVELTVDENGYVLSVYGANEDAKVLLYGETEIVGKSLDEAVERITDLAVELGYVDETNKVISTSVYTDSESVKADLEKKITDSVNKAAQKAGISLKVDSEELYSMLRELEAYKAANPDNASIQALTVSKYRLAVSASENGEITVEEAIELENSQLIEKINDAHKKAEQFATEAYNKAREEASRAYDMATQVAMDAVYIEYFADKILTNPTQFMYASFYVAYVNAARGLEALEIAAEYLEKKASADYELNAEETAAALEIFGLDESDASLIANAEGKVTVRSVGAYANKTLKNLVSEDEREALRESLDELLDEAEDRIEVLVEAAINDYKPQVDALINTVRSSISAMGAIKNPVIDSLVAEFNEVVGEYESLVEDGELSDDDLEELVEKFADKAEDYKAKIYLEISDEDKAQIEAKREQVKNKMTEQKSEFDEALADAEAEAKAYLQSLKDARRQKDQPAD